MKRRRANERATGGRSRLGVCQTREWWAAARREGRTVRLWARRTRTRMMVRRGLWLQERRRRFCKLKQKTQAKRESDGQQSKAAETRN